MAGLWTTRNTRPDHGMLPPGCCSGGLATAAISSRYLVVRRLVLPPSHSIGLSRVAQTGSLPCRGLVIRTLSLARARAGNRCHPVPKSAKKCQIVPTRPHRSTETPKHCPPSVLRSPFSFPFELNYRRHTTFPRNILPRNRKSAARFVLRWLIQPVISSRPKPMPTQESADHD